MRAQGEGVSQRTLWRTVFSRWDELIGPDLAEMYGLEVLDPRFPEQLWRPVMYRILGLLDRPSSRLTAALTKA